MRIVGLTPCAPLVLVILYIEFSKHTLLQFQSPVSSRVAFAEQLAYRTAPDLNYTWNPESEVVCRADSPNSHQNPNNSAPPFPLAKPRSFVGILSTNAHRTVLHRVVTKKDEDEDEASEESKRKTLPPVFFLPPKDRRISLSLPKKVTLAVSAPSPLGKKSKRSSEQWK